MDKKELIVKLKLLGFNYKKQKNNHKYTYEDITIIFWKYSNTKGTISIYIHDTFHKDYFQPNSKYATRLLYKNILDETLKLLGEERD